MNVETLNRLFLKAHTSIDTKHSTFLHLVTSEQCHGDFSTETMRLRWKYTNRPSKASIQTRWMDRQTRRIVWSVLTVFEHFFRPQFWVFYLTITSEHLNLISVKQRLSWLGLFVCSSWAVSTQGTGGYSLFALRWNESRTRCHDISFKCCAFCLLASFYSWELSETL